MIRLVREDLGRILANNSLGFMPFPSWFSWVWFPRRRSGTSYVEAGRTWWIRCRLVGREINTARTVV